MSLATKVLIGFVLGVASGVFFGELIAPVGIVGDAFIRLLQMTVLPYVVVSLILGLGRLSAGGAGRLIRRAGALLLVLWVVALAFVLIMPLTYPDWESGSSFSAALVEPAPELDLVRLFIPANPFDSLAFLLKQDQHLILLILSFIHLGHFVKNKKNIFKSINIHYFCFLKGIGKGPPKNWGGK